MAAEPPSDGNLVPDPGRDEPDKDKEWWDDPAMPWRHKPARADIACMSWIGFLGVFSLAMLPVRAWLLGAPERLPWLVALMGSRSGTAGLGSFVRVGMDVPFVWPILLGTLMSIKLDWVYWWAGKLWGRGIIEVWAGQSARAARNYARAERWATKLGWVGMFVAYVPIPLPVMPVVFVLTGAHGMSWRKFVLLDALSCFVWLVGFFLFGFVVGTPAVELLTLYGRVANYIVIALVVVIVVSSIMRGAKQTKQSA
ncbi:hypothetical protein GCM10009785_08680 [Brooklawnia cerclae]|uniref:Membrane protein DedA with SNARE-associated domain n=1 Tax=Brooklawnia cerclae TaxID=349934 RepID=A0ABX0SJ61_9ACTN|nr:DedA family protein [Brooklawnia cerclae]NIH58445.1 membrane protein DedA with SNARE-associated domain [Brooklawnia cerclae]